MGANFQVDLLKLMKNVQSMSYLESICYQMYGAITIKSQIIRIVYRAYQHNIFRSISVCIFDKNHK